MLPIILLSVTSMLLFLFLKIFKNSFFDVGCLLIVLWTIYIFLSLIGTINLYIWKYDGLIWLVIMLYAFGIFYEIGKRYTVKNFQNRNMVGDYDHNDIILSDTSWHMLVLLIILAFAKWGYELRINGFHLYDFSTLNALSTMNHEFAVARYSGGSSSSSILQILNIATYSAPVCGGFAFSFADKKVRKLFSLASLLPILLVTLTNNTKAGLIGGGYLFIISYLISYYYKNKKWIYFKLRTIVIALALLIALLSVLLFSMMLRIGEVSSYMLSVVLKKIIVYAFGNVQSFDIWLSDYFRSSILSYGKLTYLGIADALGLAERIQGVYTSLNETSSNVYTAFRGVISDFGIFGGLIYTSLHGLFLGMAVNTIYNSALPRFSIFYSVQCIFFFAFGMFVSPWTYLSFIAAAIIFWIFIHVALRKEAVISQVLNSEY